ARGVSHVAPEHLDPDAGPYVAYALLHLLDTTDLEESGSARRPGVHPRLDLFFREQRDVRGELTIQRAIASIGVEVRHHRLSSANDMAATTFCHSFRSTCSCRRPLAVSVEYFASRRVSALSNSDVRRSAL